MVNKKVAIIGASGYTGAVLAGLLARHPHLDLQNLYVSAQSHDAGKPLAELHGALRSLCRLSLQPLSDPQAVAGAHDAVFLATDHRVSHDLAPQLAGCGCTVFDLSGAFRIKDPGCYPRCYGFSHAHPQWLEEAVYALPEHTPLQALRQSRLIALPGCYPTAAQLALRPFLARGLLDPRGLVVINAVSGVSGAGRKAGLSNSFCEVSLNAYGIFTHRHRPEIEFQLGREVIFNPHLGNFRRGILATITAQLTAPVPAQEPLRILSAAYAGKPLIRLCSSWPRVADVAYTPYCDLYAAAEQDHIVICSAIDNLLKGAAAQAVQALNLYYGFEETAGLVWNSPGRED